jgi:hypothetical protein
MMPSRLMHPIALVSALAGTLLLGPVACQPHRVGGAPANTVPLVFSNETMEKADVYVSTTGVQGRRLGAVLGGETTTLKVPSEYYTNGYVLFWTVLRDRPQGPWVDLFNVRAGEELRVRLPQNSSRLSLIR